MAVGDRIDVHEDDDVLVFAHGERGSLTPHDFAEDAVLH
jgi:hypothetical protein